MTSTCPITLRDSSLNPSCFGSASKIEIELSGSDATPAAAEFAGFGISRGGVKLMVMSYLPSIPVASTAGGNCDKIAGSSVRHLLKAAANSASVIFWHVTSLDAKGFAILGSFHP